MTAATLDRPAAMFAAGPVPISYERRSKFRPKDLDVEVTRAVHRQAADANAACADRNWPDPLHITDEGQSASRFASRARDGWPVLLDAIRAGRASVVLVWLLDRAVRQTRDVDDLLDACREAGIKILQTGTGSLIDPDDPDSVAMAKIAATLAEAEVAKMSKRVRRAHAEKRRLGQFHGGKRRFGYNADMSALDEREAAVVRRIAADLIRGRSLNSIARELNGGRLDGPDKPATPGVPPSLWKGVPFTMAEWTGSNLGTMMRRPHLAGMRVHGKDEATKRLKVIGEASTPAILDRETWDTLQAVLDRPTRRTSPSGARRHLLSGLIACAVCGKPLRSASNGAGKPPIYTCPETHVSRSAALVDARVAGSVVALLSRPDFAAVWDDAPEAADRATLEAEIEAIEDRLADWADREMRGKATARQVERATETGMAEIAALRARLGSMAAAAAVPAVLAPVAGNPDAAAVWDGLGLGERRAIVAAVADIRLHRAARKGAPFDPASVEITWRLGGSAPA